MKLIFEIPDEKVKKVIDAFKWHRPFPDELADEERITKNIILFVQDVVKSYEETNISVKRDDTII